MIKINSKIYIAGHAGTVGSAITKKFHDEGYTNLILKNRKQLDLFNQNEVNEFFHTEKPDYVVLAAAKVGGIKDNMTHQADFIYENVQIQNNVIWSAHLHNVKKLLFLGSSCIYPRECPQPMREEYFMNGKVEPTNEGYAIAKIAGMKLCEKISAQYKKSFISCMPTNIYGPNDNFKDDSAHVIPSLIRRIHQAKINGEAEVVIWGSGNSRREFLYVDDLADAIFWLMNNYEENSFLNIGTGMDVSIKELAIELQIIIEYKGKLVFDIAKPDGMPKKLLCVEKINKLGWKYSTALKIGLEITYKWYLAHQV